MRGLAQGNLAETAQRHGHRNSTEHRASDFRPGLGHWARRGARRGRAVPRWPPAGGSVCRGRRGAGVSPTILQVIDRDFNRDGAAGVGHWHGRGARSDSESPCRPARAPAPGRLRRHLPVPQHQSHTAVATAADCGGGGPYPNIYGQIENSNLICKNTEQNLD